jgi:quinoprotein dehydrogenase-associated probable ABC transporter substrate-binding protein
MNLTKASVHTALAATAVAVAASALLAQPAAAPVAPAGTPAMAGADGVLRVCADPNNLPQSNSRGEGYENRLAQALARDLKLRLEYTFFPQRLGFVRNTLKARDVATQKYKCDLIMGVPKGYELTATTQPYMRSTYVLLVGPHAALSGLASAQDVLALPAPKLHSLRIGLFAQTPGADWALRHGLIEHAQLYPAQSGDPAETTASLVGRDLANGQIDAAILWGPIAGFLVSHADAGVQLAVLPIKPEDGIRLDYEISMGVRQGEKDWLLAVDGWISAHRQEIAQILGSYQVPLLPVSARGS